MHCLPVVFICCFRKQMVYWVCNTFIHISMNMLEVLCACWGWIQHSLSQGTYTDPLCRGGDVKFLPGAGRIRHFRSNQPGPFHSFSMRKWRLVFEGYYRTNMWYNPHQLSMNSEERLLGEYKLPKVSLTKSKCVSMMLFWCTVSICGRNT